LQPSHPYLAPAQSTNYYSEKDHNVFVSKNASPSSDPVAEKAQHDPQSP